MTMSIDFYRERTLVRIGSIVNHTLWSLQRTPGLTNKMRKLISLVFWARVGDSGVEQRTRELLSKFSFSWARYATDGTRLQIFDVKSKQVIKVAIRPDAETIRREVLLRAKMAGSCPEILDWDAEKGIVIESMLKLRPLSFGLSNLNESIALLGQGIYTRRSVRTDEYVNKLCTGKLNDWVRTALARCGISAVDLSEVHGDLWYGNLCWDDGGRMIILDWEYARTCVLSHDIWTYLFQHQKSTGGALDYSFMVRFARSVQQCLKTNWTPSVAKGYSIIHLLERLSFFQELDLHHKQEEIDHLDRELQESLRSLV